MKKIVTDVPCSAFTKITNAANTFNHALVVFNEGFVNFVLCMI